MSYELKKCNRGWNQKVVHNPQSGKLHQAGTRFVTLEEN